MTIKLRAALSLAAALFVFFPKVANACSPYGLIYDKWSALYGDLGPCEDDEHDDGAGGRTETFEYGWVDWDGHSSAAYAVYGLIGETYDSFGLAAGYGHPLNDESETSDGHGRYNDFSGGGSIYWNSSCSGDYCGPYGVYGAIFTEWGDLSWEEGPLGYPTSNATACTPESGIACYGTPSGTVYQYFAGNSSNGYAGGTMWWAPTGELVKEGDGCCLYAVGAFASDCDSYCSD